MSSGACNGDTIHRAPGENAPPPIAPRRRRCNVHCNHIWSVWYGLLTLALQAYIVYKCITRFLTYIHLPWPDTGEPYLELNLYVGLVGAGVVLLPFFFISFMFKIGNLANDGYKIGYNLSTCSMDPPSVLARSGGLIRNAWYHGGPTGPFIHLVSAFCFLLPRIIIEAKLVEVGFLSRENIWKTDLDWMVPNNDRMVVLSFFTGAGTGDGLQSTPVPAVNHPADQIRRFLQSDSNWWPCSAEYINYGLALLVFAVRYPAVFWKTNKGLSFLFSLQLIGNGIQNLMAFSAMSIMYKVHMIGSQNVLHKYEPFLLNTPICMLLYLLACIIVTASSSVIYMYGYQKFMMFLQKEREKKSIVLQEGKTSLWMYFPHTAAMCTLIALAVCNGPLLYDFTIIYKGSLDGTVLVFVITTILHLFLWIVTWLFLTVKMSWKFKLRVTVGRASVHNAKSIKLVNDIDLHHQPVDKENAPMLIVGFGKTFTVHDPGPKKLIMRTLARAAMETDRALEEEDMYWLKGDTPTGKINGSSTNTVMRVHASPSLNKKGGTSGVDEEDSNQSPRRIVQGQRSPVNNTVQDTDDRIPKESIYGTIRTKGKQRPGAEGEASISLNCHLASRIEEEDLDTLPPPPLDDGFEESKQPLLAPPKPAPRKGPNQDVLDVHTPRSNRSIDSGLPDSSSTTSSTSPPGQHQPDIDLQQHRKSTSLDNITLPGEGKPNSWKSYSLQRGLLPPSQEEQEAHEKDTLVIMRNNSGIVGPEGPASLDQEDIYGRCTNMKLTSFSEGVPSNSPRDPRIIDLAQSTACGSPRQMSATNPGGILQPNLPQSQHNLNHVPQQPNNFNTLPANMAGPPHPQVVHNPVNTLPARVNVSPPRTNQPHFNGHHPTGRHFKPFDHRRMNPMAEIQENPHEVQYQNHEIQNTNHVNHGNHEMPHPPDPSYGQIAENNYNPDTTYVVHHNKHIPYMPAELKHTNYNTKPQLVHPQVMQYRDSANYSCASSDSG